MAKQNRITPEKFNQQVTQLKELWEADKMVEFSRLFMSLRWRYSKTLVNKMLQTVTDQLSKKEEGRLNTNILVSSPPKAKTPDFILFDNGSNVEAIEDIWSGGEKNHRYARKGDIGTVIENNHLNSNRYIIIRFGLSPRTVVTPAYKFKAASSKHIKHA